jgi:BirA family transcriptional regulator, biotin operon repressor / biotin---[acetyl-CoA-carboxylase] ligase
MPADPPLAVESIRAHLGESCSLVRELLLLDETPSTNDLAFEFGRQGAASGLVIFAERQSAGRGRFGRRWESAAHCGLWFSLLLRPELSLDRWPRLTTWAACSVAAAVDEAAGVRSAIKWPNDLQLSGRKIAGILIETGADAAQRSFAIVGIGVNVNHAPGDFPAELAELAGSLRIATGQAHDRNFLAAAILRHLDRRWPLLESGFRQMIAEASARSSLLGRPIEVRSAGSQVRGIAEEIDDEGLLLLRTDDGRLHRLSAGEATLRG